MHIESIQTILEPQKGAILCRTSTALRVTGSEHPLIRIESFVVTSPTQVYDIASYGGVFGREYDRRRMLGVAKGCDRYSSTNLICDGPSSAYSYKFATPI